MTTLLAILSLLVAWALLGVILVGLLLTVKSLQSTRHWFEKTTVGLRAVEHQTTTLADKGEALTSSLRETLAALNVAFERHTHGTGDRGT